MAYAKIHPSMMTSNIWQESPEIIKVWFTLLLMADKNGFIADKLPGITRKALLPVEVCERALKSFSTPDEKSASKEHEGRRIIEKETGWQIVNYEKYNKKGEDTTPVTYVDNVHKYNKEHAVTKTPDINLIYPEFGPNSWMFALDIWKNAGPLLSKEGRPEKFQYSKVIFAKYINKDNWKEFIQKLDWAVTNSNRYSERAYLGFLHTFISKKRWQDVEAPNELITQEKVKQVVRWDQESLPDELQ